MPEATETKIDELRLVAPSAAGNPVADAHAAGVGTVIVTSFRMFPFLPLRAQWIAIISEFEWNHYFTDVQSKGPFKSWQHRHEFLAESRGGIEGTLVRDVVDYEVGFGFLGWFANLLLVERQMRGTFAARQKVLPGLLS
jgi:ligand-binding SRPBCC domain-containing protein